MRRIAVLVLTLAVLAAGSLQARADVIKDITNILFGNEVYAEGIVNYVQPSWFSILHDGNKFTRVLIPNGLRVPFDIQVGNQVGVTMRPDNYGNLYLTEIEKLQDSVPLPPPTRR